MDPIDEWLMFLSEIRRTLEAIAESVELEVERLRDESEDCEDREEGGEA